MHQNKERSNLDWSQTSLPFIMPDARLILGDAVLALQDAQNTNAEPRYLN